MQRSINHLLMIGRESHEGITNPETYLRHVLTVIADQSVNHRVAELLPWNLSLDASQAPFQYAQQLIQLFQTHCAEKIESS
jgi:hypothetical protein